MAPLLIVITVLAALLVLLFAAAIFAVAPGKKRDMSVLRGARIAHRGLYNPNAGIPENTLAAFAAAHDAGFGVELDVQLTTDGVVVVHHDASLKRTAGSDAVIAKSSYEQLSGIPLTGTGLPVPKFEEALRVLDGVPIVCEVKNHNGNRCDTLCRLTAELFDTYNGFICMESFSPYITRWFKKNRPDIIRGQLAQNMNKNRSHGFIERLMMTNLYVNAISRPDFVAYNYNHAHGIGFRFFRFFTRGFAVGWTPRGADAIAQAERDFDAVIFEDFT